MTITRAIRPCFTVLVGIVLCTAPLAAQKVRIVQTNAAGDNVHIIDPATNKVVGDIKFEPKGFRPDDLTPVGITMTRDGKRAYVGLGRANHVAVVSVPDRKVTGYTLVGKRAWNVVLTRDEKTLYVCNGLSDDLSVVDTATLKVSRSVPVGRVPYMAIVDD